jgi:hypothetical protein
MRAVILNSVYLGLSSTGEFSSFLQVLLKQTQTTQIIVITRLNWKQNESIKNTIDIYFTKLHIHIVIRLLVQGHQFSSSFDQLCEPMQRRRR